jgi:hypothetical protein
MNTDLHKPSLSRGYLYKKSYPQRSANTSVGTGHLLRWPVGPIRLPKRTLINRDTPYAHIAKHLFRIAAKSWNLSYIIKRRQVFWKIKPPISGTRTYCGRWNHMNPLAGNMRLAIGSITILSLTGRGFPTIIDPSRKHSQDRHSSYKADHINQGYQLSRVLPESKPLRSQEITNLVWNHGRLTCWKARNGAFQDYWNTGERLQLPGLQNTKT